MALFDYATRQDRKNVSDLINATITAARNIERERCVQILKSIQPAGSHAWTEDQLLVYEVLEYAISFINSGNEINNEVNNLLRDI